MRCCAIINFWDCAELLPYAVKQWNKCGIDVIIVYSNASNYRHVTNNSAFLMRPEFNRCFVVKCEPLDTLSPAENERRKRNYGLQKAREAGYSHFITADADEFYEPFEIDWDLEGTVLACRTYFKSPQLTIGLDRTLVPFVHKLTPKICYEMNKRYPFAWDPGIRIDPTRQFNITSGVVFNDKIIMHHMSWIRKDFNRKIENSTARDNIRRSTILKDLENAREGYLCNFYGKTLMHVPNYFNLPSWEN